MYPKKLQPILNRMAGYNTNVYKIMPLNVDTCTSGKIISVRLPTNCLADLTSFTMMFDAKVTDATANNFGRLPNRLTSLIERVEILCGGLTIAQSFNGYGTAQHIKHIVEGSQCSQRSRHVNNHEDVCLATNVYGEDISTSDEVYPKSGSTIAKSPTFFINDWLGFLQELQPKVLDLGLMSEVMIRITLASDDVCSVATANGAAVAGTAKFELSNIFFTLNTIAIDGVYEDLLEEKIKRDGFLEIPYKQYYSYFSRHTGSTRFSASSQSIDKIYTVLRKSTYNTQGGAVAVPNGDRVDGHEFPQNLTKYLEFVPGGVTDYQYQINNVLYPQFKAGQMDAYRALKMCSDKTENELSTIHQFLTTHFIFPLRLNCDNQIEHLNGFDSRNTNSIMEFSTTGLDSTNDYDSFVLVETTSCLKVGAGKAIEIVL